MVVLDTCALPAYTGVVARAGGGGISGGSTETPKPDSFPARGYDRLLGKEVSSLDRTPEICFTARRGSKDSQGSRGIRVPHLYHGCFFYQLQVQILRFHNGSLLRRRVTGFVCFAGLTCFVCAVLHPAGLVLGRTLGELLGLRLELLDAMSSDS